MEAIHKNDLSAYLSDWKMKMEMINILKILSKIGKNKPQPIPKTFQAIFIQTNDLQIVLIFGFLSLKKEESIWYTTISLFLFY